MSNRLALYTTVYPGIEPYIATWYESVVEQTDRDFDLWIGLDSIVPERVSEMLGIEVPDDINYLEPGSGTPAQIRGRSLEQIIDIYDAVIFVDSDDLLAPTRVEAARKQLEECDVTACALLIIDEAGVDLGILFGDMGGEQLETILPRYNIFGLSNTAYRCDVLRECLPLGRDCELFDWSLVTRAWDHGARLNFEREPQMSYRQYESNIAKVLSPFFAEDIVAASKRVASHYRCLLESDRPVNRRSGRPSNANPSVSQNLMSDRWGPRNIATLRGRAEREEASLCVVVVRSSSGT